ncbi:tRNA-guanine transglycosylase [Calocera viscosa TUFC12733]|uniref:tRNA-guanine transglycosylase n=1 Tax=Calocera viscosa (strain TUFC12733) TaxID=1330018 RepID=A0A167PYY7_CALVF|nr:tRNA-guanine transglycosylase [Calocera viscosa TUFC12733]
MSGATARSPPVLSFKLLTASSNSFSPRLGIVQLNRSSAETIEVLTPGLFLHTSRGHVPHLSGDHVNRMAKHMPWLHASFEGFLETLPPTPTLQPGPNPLHTFIGAPASRHIISLSFRDPADVRERPPNGENYLTGLTVRGVRKIVPTSYRSYISAVQPDVVVALSDIPFTSPPYSQKRVTKSMDRSIRWLGDLLRGTLSSKEIEGAPVKNVLVSLLGGTNHVARRIFSESLLGPLEEGRVLSSTRHEKLAPLDDRISGYVLEMASLRMELAVDHFLTPASMTHAREQVHKISTLLQASLSPLPMDKLRAVHSAMSPQEMLHLIASCGVDLFDSYWAQKAADWGIALDFSFPVTTEEHAEPMRRLDGRRDVGHNLYDSVFAYDFRSFLGTGTEVGLNTGCACIACSPSFTKPILHGILERNNVENLDEEATFFTRAYVHHLLHTHEMSAHALLVSHNIVVLQEFFAGVRSVLKHNPQRFAAEVARFEAEYDGEMRIMEEARRDWETVDLARGKGRLARERKAEPGAIGPPMGIVADNMLGA